jgi:excisionase family DNA binding protein
MLIADDRRRRRRPKRKTMIGPLVYTADELAVMLGLDRKTIYEFATRGDIPCRRLGRRVLFPRSAIERWLAEVKTK